MPISPANGARSTPKPIGSPYAASLAQNRLADTGISLPSGGWIRLIGSVATGAYFALTLPVALLRSELTAKAPGDNLMGASIFGAGSAHSVAFAASSGGGLLVGSVTAGAATVAAYRE